MTVSIDIETYSEIDISTCGAYRYANHPSFEILIFAYCIIDDLSDEKEIIVLDFAKDGEDATMRAANVLNDATVIKAHNAIFEKTCLEVYFGKLDVIWDCTLVKSAYCGLPLALGQVAMALGLTNGKDVAGGMLIRYFSIPQKPTAKNGMKVRNYPNDNLELWERYLEYCRQDVRVEMEIAGLLEKIKVPSSELYMWQLDQKINNRGVYIDVEFAIKAIQLNEYVRTLLMEEASRITRLANPNSAKQLMAWLNDTIADGENVSTLKKEDVRRLIVEYGGDADADLSKVLRIRQQLSKTSVKKYHAFLKTASKDRRVRGLFQYYGANRTGRWAGRLVQLQNLPRGMWNEEETSAKVAMHKEAIKALDPESYLLEYSLDQSLDVLSSMIRSTIVAPKGKKLVVADLSAIEARVLAWFANETWRLEVFATHGKIYEASASRMFKMDIADVTKSIRAKGKVAELALGYQGGANALIQMGALDMGLTVDELDPIKTLWRKSNPNICEFWLGIEKAVRMAFMTTNAIAYNYFKIRILKLSHKLSFLQIKLPSGRSLFYANPSIEKGKLHYWGLDDRKKWAKIPTYGGKLTENLTQAVARDVLAEGLKRADEHGFDINLHVHDEIGIEGDEHDLPTLVRLMSEPISWAIGLPLGADGFISDFYRK